MLIKLEEVLLHDLMLISKAYRTNNIPTDYNKYAHYLVDKFATHSATLHHIAAGYIPREKNGKKGFGFDIFSFHSVLRVLIETYVCFYQIFVSHKTEEEKQLCYMLWKLNSLNSLSKYDLEYAFAQNELQNAKLKASHLCTKIEKNSFLKSLPKGEASKIFNPENEHVS